MTATLRAAAMWWSESGRTRGRVRGLRTPGLPGEGRHSRRDARLVNEMASVFTYYLCLHPSDPRSSIQGPL